MLETLREFRLEALVLEGEIESTRQAHAEYYLFLAEKAASHLKGSEQARWIARLEQDHENLRASLSFLLERTRVQVGRPEGQQQAERSLRLCIALPWFWILRGYMPEGYSFMESAFELREEVVPEVKARALLAVADLAWGSQGPRAAEKFYEESPTLPRIG